MLVVTYYKRKTDAAMRTEENGCRIALEHVRVARATLKDGNFGHGCGQLYLY